MSPLSAKTESLHERSDHKTTDILDTATTAVIMLLWVKLPPISQFHIRVAFEQQMADFYAIVTSTRMERGTAMSEDK